MCCKSFNKIFLFIINIIVFLFGAVLLGVGIWVAVNKDSLFGVMDVLTNKVDNWNEDAYNNYKNSNSLLRIGAFIAIGVGAFAFLVGGLGCIGACKQSKCMLGAYAGLLLLIVILEVTGGILVAVYKSQVEKELKIRLKKLDSDVFVTITQTLKDKNNFRSTVTELLNYAHVNWQCCGVDGPGDITNQTTQWSTSSYKYYTIGNFNRTLNFPVTCCKMKNKDNLMKNKDWHNYADYLENQNCPDTELLSSTRNTKGCYQEVSNYVKVISIPLIAVAIGIGLLELICIIAACVLIRQISNSDEYKN